MVKKNTLWLTVILGLLLAVSLYGSGGDIVESGHAVLTPPVPLPLEAYAEAEAARAAELGLEVDSLGLIETLKVRIAADPINLVATLLFFGAIIHTFAAGRFLKLSRKYERAHQERLKQANPRNYIDDKDPVDFRATLFHFLGEVEVVFGIWVLPLLVTLTLSKGWTAAYSYIDTRNYTEPLFVVVIMAIAATRPVVSFAEKALSVVASLGGRSPAAWWLSILIVAPLLGSFITEPAAMTIAAMLLARQFYQHQPSTAFKYATIGLLFVNVSVGGTLTHFAAPPILMIATIWEWDLPFVFVHLGIRAVIGILIATSLYYLVFRKQFAALAEETEAVSTKAEGVSWESVPSWVVAIHLGFLAWTVFTLHHPPLFIGGFLFFVAFVIATDHHQYSIALKGPILVGFFLAGLVTHGGLQAWWIAPVLSSLSEVPLFVGATLLTAFNDNAAITFLASQVPAFDPHTAADGLRAVALQQAVVAGAVTGGGLTVIANAPNPAGQSILSKYFGGDISPLKLLAGAVLPTCVMAAVFLFLPH